MYLQWLFVTQLTGTAVYEFDVHVRLQIKKAFYRAVYNCEII